jgi:hypothetical protein
MSMEMSGLKTYAPRDDYTSLTADDGDALHRPAPVPMDLDGSLAVDKNQVSGRELLVSHIGSVESVNLQEQFPSGDSSSYPKFPLVKVSPDKKPPLPFSI